METTKTDFSLIDRPEILQILFHPRSSASGEKPASGAAVLQQIPVGEAIEIGACFHMKDRVSPNILFFHGNGEIVADYDDLGPIYNQLGINFLAVDYRGYGTSTGRPTVAAMMADCHKIFHFVKTWLSANGYIGPLLVMGRSLGSASALELAATHSNDISGLIIESGFAYVGPLLALLGAPPEVTADEDALGFRNLGKIKLFTKPALIIHAELDHIIPFADGRALYDASGSQEKTFLKIPGANHNDIFARALSEYMTAVANLAYKTMPGSAVR
ncbi:MAG: alpha/beta fold hydrolase [Desulfobacterales bacterium]|jgi:fermentation-respiration switch protein FrsA (DUF1100 family)|nr:alpha/beta fold hydrolase [Desulfobacterales bacterium]